MPAPEELGQLIKRAQHRHHRALDAALSSLGLTLVQWNALRAIARHPNSCQRALAALTFNSDQSFGALTTRLVKQRLVTRTPGKGKAFSLKLSARGRTLLRRGQVSFSKVLGRSFSVLEERERVVLQRLLAKVLDGPEL